MDAVLLSRIQFALTVGFHFLFPPLTIGMACLIVLFMYRYYKSESEADKDTAKFWVKLFGLSFAVGVATGLTMEFQFGTNWSTYSRFVGDVFGAPLAIESIFSFFLESTFIAVLLLGWNKFSPKMLLFSSAMVALGAVLSAFWILVANSWQQTPAGFQMVNGRAEMTSFLQMTFNPSTMPRFLHTLDAAIMTGAMFMLGVCALLLLRKKHVAFAKNSIRPALYTALITALLQLPSGHYHAVQVAQTQPAKLAAIEGLFETQSNAPVLLFGIPDPDNAKMNFDIRVPGLLSLLAHGRLDAKVTGLNDIPRDEWPPLNLTFYPFHLMVMIGMYFIGYTLLGALLLYRKQLFENVWYLRLAVLTIPLPFLVNELGWITAEVGRQPWVVYKLLRTSDAISVTVPAGQILATIIMFSVLYALIFAAWFVLIRKEIDRGPGSELNYGPESGEAGS